MWNLLADKLIAYAQKTPYFHLPGYMRRWWVFRFWETGRVVHRSGAVSIYSLLSARIHHILRSDMDRALHDHPWWYITIILKGGYYEVTPVDGPRPRRAMKFNTMRSGELKSYYRKWYGPGSIRFARAKQQHRLEIPKGATAWTLFIHGPKCREWGYQVPAKGWVHNEEYEANQ